MITGNTFEMKPLEVIIGTSTVKDAGLPTYQEVTALVDAQEAARVAGSSKLVSVWRKLEYSHNNLSLDRMKLFDGVRENLALSTGRAFFNPMQKNEGDRFLELGFSKVDISFNKVVVSGWDVNDRNVALKIRNNGQLEKPAIDRTENKEHSVTFYLKETISPEAMRLEFLAEDQMEVYEVEVF